MRRFRIIMLLGLLEIAAPLVNAAQLNAAPLHTGDMLPQISGRTVNGKQLKIPASTAGRATVVVFSFSRASGKDARLWNEHIASNFPDSVSSDTVIMLEFVPKLFRGMALSGIKSTMPSVVQDRSIVSYRDERLWKQRLAATDDSRAYVLLLGPTGHIRWRNSEGFSDAEYAKLKREIQEQIQFAKQHGGQ